MSNKITLWIDTQSNSIYSGWQSLSRPATISLTQGDNASIEIHMFEGVGDSSVEIPFSQSSQLKCAIGRIDNFPTSGSFFFTYGVNSVLILLTNTLTEVNELINAMPSIISAGGVVVSFVNKTTYRVLFNQIGSRLVSSIDATSLYPRSSSSSIVVSAGTASLAEIQHIKVKTIPVAYSETFIDTEQPTISIEATSPQTYRITLTSSPLYGNFTISNGTKTTGAISWKASAADVYAALNQVGISTVTTNPAVAMYSVVKNANLSWDISRISGQSEVLSVAPVGMVGFSGKVGNLNLNSQEIEDILSGLPSASAIIEIEFTEGSIKKTIYQGVVNILNDLVDNSIYYPTVFPPILSDPPHDGILYGRKDGGWSAFVGDANNIPDYNNGTTYTVGNQVYYQGKLYRMIVAAGAAGYDPIGMPSYWESLSGINDLSNYLTKDGGSLNSGAQLDFDNSFGVSSIGPMGAGFYEVLGQKNVVIYNDRIELADGVGNPTIVTTNGITFPDATVQTTAYTGGGGTWGSITGTLSNQIDLQNELGGKLSNTGGSAYWISFGNGTYIDGTTVQIMSGSVLNADQATSASLPNTTIQNGHFLSLADTGFIKAEKGDGSSVYNSTFELKSDNFEYEYSTGVDVGSLYKQVSIGDIQQYPLITLSQYSYIQGDPIIDQMTQGIIGYEIAQDGGSKSVIKSDSIKISNSIEGILANIGIEKYSNIERGFIKVGVTPYRYVSWHADIDNHTLISHNSIRVSQGTPNINVQYYQDVVYTELTANGIRFKDGSQQLTAAVSVAQSNLYALKSGTAFTGKVVFTPIPSTAPINLGSQSAAPTTTVAGDLWVATNLQFRASDGVLKTTANSNTANTFSQPQIIQSPIATTTAALRVTQLGTGNAIEVEDSTTPDANRFVVDQFGKVGVGVAPDATAAIKVDGNGISFNGLVLSPTATTAHTTSTATADLLVTINGVDYRIDLRPA